MNPIQKTETAATQKKHNILSAPSDSSIDNITRLAALFLDVPIVLLTFLEDGKTNIKAAYGLNIQELNNDYSLGDALALQNDVYIAEDAQNDPLLQSNPLVTGTFGLRFYAAVPLKLRDGSALGTLCIMDKRPGKPDNKQREILQSLARILMDNIEVRHAAHLAIDNKNQVLKTIAHDLKNPLSSINVLADLLPAEKDNRQAIDMISSGLKNASLKMKNRLSLLSELAVEEVVNI